jgi:hypothetical protein
VVSYRGGYWPNWARSWAWDGLFSTQSYTKKKCTHVYDINTLITYLINTNLAIEWSSRGGDGVAVGASRLQWPTQHSRLLPRHRRNRGGAPHPLIPSSPFRSMKLAPNSNLEWNGMDEDESRPDRKFILILVSHERCEAMLGKCYNFVIYFFIGCMLYTCVCH